MSEPQTAPAFVELKYPERKRTYHFATGNTFTVFDVLRVASPPGRSHRIETKDGRKYIVPPGWVAIEIEVDEWSY